MPGKARESKEKPAVLQEAEADVEWLKQELVGEIRRQGYSQREVSLALGMGPTYLANIFRGSGSREPAILRLDVFLAILKMLGLAPGAVLTSLDEAHEGQPPSAFQSPLRAAAERSGSVRGARRYADREHPSPQAENLRAVVEELEELLGRARAALPGDEVSPPRGRPAPRRRL